MVMTARIWALSSNTVTLGPKSRGGWAVTAAAGDAIVV
jgi:hypothetical protein